MERPVIEEGKRYICWQQQVHIPKTAGTTWYVSDLPGCTGRKRAAMVSTSDYGFTSKRENALVMTAEEARAFCAWAEQDTKRPYHVHEERGEK